MSETPDYLHANQDALFGADSTVSFGQTDPSAQPTITTEFTLPDETTAVIPAVTDKPELQVAGTTDARARAAHLIKSLDFIAGWNMRSGFRYASSAQPHRGALEQRYGDHLDDLSNEVAYNKSQFLKAARTEFKYAYEEGMGPVEVDDTEFKQGWRDFYTSYAGSDNRSALVAHRKGLKKLVKLEGTRSLGDLYDVNDAAPLSEADLTVLNKQAKLDIFKDDKRLQFYPATNREEEQARRALNYIDETHGVHSMLDEIAGKNYKDARKAGLSDTKARQASRMARTSVIHEWGSYLGDAKVQLGLLQDFANKLDGLNPDLTIAEAIAGEHPAVAILVREQDIEVFHAKGKAALGFDPLLTQEDRGPQLNPERNKAVHDRYTVSTPEDMIHERITNWAHTTTLAELNRSRRLGMLITRQRNRGSYWDRLLLATEGADKRVATEIREEHGLSATA